MTELEKLKLQAADWFYAREEAQGRLSQANQKLQQITTAIQKLQSQEQDNGTTENS